MSSWIVPQQLSLAWDPFPLLQTIYKLIELHPFNYFHVELIRKHTCLMIPLQKYTKPVIYSLWLKSLLHYCNFEDISVSGRFYWVTFNQSYQPPADDDKMLKNGRMPRLGKTAKVDCGKEKKHRGCRRTIQEGLGKNLVQPMSITQAWAMAEWEVVMDQSRLPLSRERAQRGQA